GHCAGVLRPRLPAVGIDEGNDPHPFLRDGGDQAEPALEVSASQEGEGIVVARVDRRVAPLAPPAQGHAYDIRAHRSDLHGVERIVFAPASEVQAAGDELRAVRLEEARAVDAQARGQLSRIVHGRPSYYELRLSLPGIQAPGSGGAGIQYVGVVSSPPSSPSSIGSTRIERNHRSSRKTAAARLGSASQATSTCSCSGGKPSSSAVQSAVESGGIMALSPERRCNVRECAPA